MLLWLADTSPQLWLSQAWHHMFLHSMGILDPNSGCMPPNMLWLQSFCHKASTHGFCSLCTWIQEANGHTMIIISNSWQSRADCFMHCDHMPWTVPATMIEAMMMQLTPCSNQSAVGMIAVAAARCGQRLLADDCSSQHATNSQHLWQMSQCFPSGKCWDSIAG